MTPRAEINARAAMILALLSRTTMPDEDTDRSASYDLHACLVAAIMIVDSCADVDLTTSEKNQTLNRLMNILEEMANTSTLRN